MTTDETPQAATERPARPARRERPARDPNRVSNKVRLTLARQAMPERDADERSRTFEEVNLGFSADVALMEAKRCLECAKPHCTAGWRLIPTGR